MHLSFFCLAALLLGAAWTGWRAQQRLAQELPPAWEGRDLWLVGRVDSLPQSLLGQGGAPGWRFALALEGLQDPAASAEPPELERLPQRPGDDADMRQTALQGLRRVDETAQRLGALGEWRGFSQRPA